MSTVLNLPPEEETNITVKIKDKSFTIDPIVVKQMISEASSEATKLQTPKAWKALLVQTLSDYAGFPLTQTQMFYILLQVEAILNDVKKKYLGGQGPSGSLVELDSQEEN